MSLRILFLLLLFLCCGCYSTDSYQIRANKGLRIGSTPPFISYGQEVVIDQADRVIITFNGQGTIITVEDNKDNHEQ